MNWEQFSYYTAVLASPPTQFLDAISDENFLANSLIRWNPVYFEELQRKLSATETKARRLKPFIPGKTIRNPYPGFEERKAVLQSWDGKY